MHSETLTDIKQGCIPFKFKDEKLSHVPAVAHLDGTARVQTISKKTGQKQLYALIKAFYDEFWNHNI